MKIALSNVTSTLINKSPKILIILIVMFALSRHQESLFGFPTGHESTDTTTIGTLATVPESLLVEQFGSHVTLHTDDQVMFEARDSAGQIAGYVISSRKFASTSRGYAGETPIAVFLDQQQIIRGVALLENNETGRFVSTLTQSGFFQRWNSTHILDPMPRVDAVSGVTMTSRSVLHNFDATMSYLISSYNQDNDSSLLSYLGTFAAIAVAALAMMCCIYPQKMRKWRLPILVLSILVLGIWQGAFVSIDLMYNWIIYGTSLGQRTALVLIVLASILMPLIFNRPFYCMYLCPFGAAQELMGKLNKSKLIPPRTILMVFGWIKRLFLAAIVVLLFVNPNFEPSEVEPFTIFLIKSAAVSVIIIASLSLIASIFIQRAWCRLICPTGEILSFLQTKVEYKLKKKRDW